MLLSAFDYLPDPRDIVSAAREASKEDVIRNACRAAFSHQPATLSELADQGVLLLRLTRMFDPEDPFHAEVGRLFEEKSASLAAAGDRVVQTLVKLLLKSVNDLADGVQTMAENKQAKVVQRLCKNLREELMSDSSLLSCLSTKRLFRVAVMGEIDYRVDDSSEDLLEMAIPHLTGGDVEDTWGLFIIRVRLLKSYLASNPYSQSEIVSNLLYLLFSTKMHPSIISERAASTLLEIAEQFIYYERFAEARGVLDCYVSTLRDLDYKHSNVPRIMDGIVRQAECDLHTLDLGRAQEIFNSIYDKSVLRREDDSIIALRALHGAAIAEVRLMAKGISKLREVIVKERLSKFETLIKKLTQKLEGENKGDKQLLDFLSCVYFSLGEYHLAVDSFEKAKSLLEASLAVREQIGDADPKVSLFWLSVS
eukprot:TRINITY_DN4428_c0_g1_i13.p1 TRINITY_DN4428_c0_g1~~TRINITY_DN4428_c0_g1_i13.p1  ORF type:complete len:423 (+),score=85.20 TRINITY_DN4428_c0_g1_i13:592-1860(+)